MIHHYDTLCLVRDTLNLNILNDTLIVKNINNAIVQNTFQNDIFKTFVPVIATLSGVIIGFLFNVYNESRKEKIIRYDNFINELIDYSNGNKNYNKLIIAYSKIPKDKKAQFVEITKLGDLKPNEKHILLEKLITKI